MSHPFGDLVSQHLHRKHGLSQAKLAAGILQDPSIIGKMCKGQRLHGVQARERVCATIDWLHQQAVLTTVAEANGLLDAAGMVPLRAADANEARLLQQLRLHSPEPPLSAIPRSPVTTTPRTNLPAALTSFVGRTAAVMEVTRLIANYRLVTLTGAGGVGKTRLALEVGKAILDSRFWILDSAAPQPANRKSKIENPKFPDGIWFVDLTPLTDPQAIPQRILDLWRVPEQAERSPLESLIAYLRAKETLLILDNCEHLINACAAFAETLLQHCPQLSLLATSREALNIGGETPWRVPSLTRPRAGAGWDEQAVAGQPQFTPDTLARFEAVALFVERATVRQPGFALTTANAGAVAHICSRLDGIPLALEMAAARVNIFTVEELAEGLDGAFDSRFQMLTSGTRTAPLRHQTLRATLEWSYGLLTAKEQWLLACLAVFSGGWTFAAAAEVTGCSLDQLAQLVNKSLVIADQQNGETRYRMLETVRQFAAERLKHSESWQRSLYYNHSRYYLNLLANQEGALGGPQQKRGLEIVRADHDNIHVAWYWAVEQQVFELLALAASALFLHCEICGSFQTDIVMFEQAVATLEGATAVNSARQAALQPLLGQLLIRLGICEGAMGDYQRSGMHLQAGLQLVTTDSERAFALLNIGTVAGEQGNLILMRDYLAESLKISRQANDLSGIARALQLAHTVDMKADWDETCRNYAKNLALWRKVGRPDRIVNGLIELGWYEWYRGHYTHATAFCHSGLEITEQEQLDIDPVIKAWALDCMGCAAWSQGQIASAESYIREALAIYTDFGRQSMLGSCKADLSMVLHSTEKSQQAIELAREAIAISQAINNHMILVKSVNYLGAALTVIGDFEEARQMLRKAIQQAWEHDYLDHLINAFYYFAELLVSESQLNDAVDRLKHYTFAVTLLSCVCTQKAAWHAFKVKAAQLQAEIEAALPPEVRTAAVVRGQSCTLEEMATTLLGAMPVD